MNWLQRFFTNPNNHAVISGLSNAAQTTAFMLGHPEVGLAISAVGTAAGFQSAATPENPVPVPMPAIPIPGHASGGPVVQLPPAAAGGTYHAADWAALAVTLANTFGQPAARS